MRKVNKLAAAIAVALGMGIATQANAVIELKANGKGDALIFPAFNGYVENYFTVSNGSNQWVQGHLRFRGAAWSGELRDFDVILSPGDVFVFRVADLDGDGQWEIDQSLDKKNFAYTAQTKSCGPGDDLALKTRADCMDPSNRLIPAPSGQFLTAAVVEHQKHVGYVEFFGEAVLNNMTPDIMANLLTGSPNVSNKPYQDTLFSRTGTNAWKWSDAANGWRTCTVAPTTTTAGGAGAAGVTCDNGLSDVGNVLSGTAFVTVPGRSQGLAYNAEALVNFRTASGHGTHRIDNYRANNYVSIDAAAATQAASSAVIVHEDTGARGNGPSPYGDYVYHFGAFEDRNDEARVSFNNTWGPTLADGDDYDLGTLRDTSITGFDDWEAPVAGAHHLPTNTGNSIAEIEEAIRAGGQAFTSYYFDGAKLGSGDSLKSWFFVHFPTKFYYGESGTFYGKTKIEDYVVAAVNALLQMGKPISPEIWDINEVSGVPGAAQGCISPDPCSEVKTSALGHELSFFGVDFFKNVFTQGSAASFTNGRVVLAPTAVANNPKASTGGNRDLSWPMMGYTFETGGSEIIGQWRSMQR